MRARLDRLRVGVVRVAVVGRLCWLGRLLGRRLRGSRRPCAHIQHQRRELAAGYARTPPCAQHPALHARRSECASGAAPVHVAAGMRWPPLQQHQRCDCCDTRMLPRHAREARIAAVPPVATVRGGCARAAEPALAERPGADCPYNCRHSRRAGAAFARTALGLTLFTAAMVPMLVWCHSSRGAETRAHARLRPLRLLCRRRGPLRLRQTPCKEGSGRVSESDIGSKGPRRAGNTRRRRGVAAARLCACRMAVAAHASLSPLA